MILRAREQEKANLTSRPPDESPSPAHDEPQSTPNELNGETRTDDDHQKRARSIYVAVVVVALGTSS